MYYSTSRPRLVRRMGEFLGRRASPPPPLLLSPYLSVGIPMSSRTSTLVPSGCCGPRHFRAPRLSIPVVTRTPWSSAGNYCQLSTSSVGSDASFSCDDDPCAATFFRNAHDLPGSQFHFNHGLLPATTWWQDQFEAGFDHLVFCGLAEPKPASTLSGVTTTTVTATATGSAVVFSSSSLVTGSGADKASAETISAAAAKASASVTTVTTPAAAHRSSPLLWGCVSALLALSIMLAMLALV